MMAVDAQDLGRLIPHAGAMCLLDAVVNWNEETVHAVGSRHVGDPSHPLHSDAGLHAVHLIEYGAQAMAVHGALLARQSGDTKVRPGRLVSLRDVVLTDEYVDLSRGRLDVHAQCLYAQGSGSQYLFRIEQCDRLLASGRAAVIHADT
jgi:predicted hotdog family 3-hydroxylacyl-ACP dehydratase